MDKEEILKVILDYEIELLDEYNDTIKAFGYYDKSSQRLQTQLVVIYNLKDKLNFNTIKKDENNDEVNCEYCGNSWYKYQKDVGMNVYECGKCGSL